MFEQMIAAIQEETLRRLFTVRLKTNEEIKRERVAKITGESGADDGSVKRQPVKKVQKIGRNDPCPCGSGLKWKKCTCKEYHPTFGDGEHSHGAAKKLLVVGLPVSVRRGLGLAGPVPETGWTGGLPAGGGGNLVCLGSRVPSGKLTGGRNRL